MGVHSTVFGPVKYAILPQHLGEKELLLGTGLVEGATFVAILLGQVAGGLLPAAWAGPVAVAVAVLGWLASCFIPPAPPSSAVPIDWNPLSSTRCALGEAFANTELRIATICISWFWALGAIYTTQFVPLAKNDLGGTQAVATLFLAAFSIGIALGSAGVSRLTGGHISTRLVPWAGLAMALAGADLYFSVAAFDGRAGSVGTFIVDPRGWRVLADLGLLSVAGGIFSVPLYGVLQTATNGAGRARAIAANNVVNSAFQVGGVLAIGAAINRGVGVPAVLLGAGLTVLLLLPLLRRLPR
jgi:acyl-[acyl-carrier-protein]-phospholipid O-acyltransferase/long-chain-fatty-acid--[acyl-carrier-protein] ligase